MWTGGFALVASQSVPMLGEVALLVSSATLWNGMDANVKKVAMVGCRDGFWESVGSVA